MACMSSTDPANLGPLGTKVYEYGTIMKRIIDHDSKQAGFTAEGWRELAAMVDTAKFERVGNFLEVVTWQEYAEMLTQWAVAAGWEFTFKRITEVDNRVIQELEERSEVGGGKSTVNSVSVYEFDKAGKIVHLDIYLQMKPQEMEMANTGGWADASAA